MIARIFHRFKVAFIAPREVNFADGLNIASHTANGWEPGGPWNTQTTKFVRREPCVKRIPHVRLPSGPLSEYRLRTQRSDQNLCTLEAIAKAIGALESREVQASLETLMRVLVERTLWSRGLLSAKRCTTAGIPPEAFCS